MFSSLTTSLSLCFHFVLQAWWVGDGFFADVWKICTTENFTNCTDIDDSFSRELKPMGKH